MSWIRRIFYKIFGGPKKKDPWRIVCLVGESGCGKTTIASALEEQFGLKQVASYTTRPKRYAKEKHHRFVSKEEFDALRLSFVACTVFHGHEYGATDEQLDSAHLFVVDPEGIKELARNWGRDRLMVIYVHTTMPERLRRLREEREEEDELAQQLVEHDIWKFAGFHDYDVMILNENKEQLARNIQSLGLIIRSWCCRDEA